MNESGALQGLSVLVTRPTHQAEPFCRLLASAGGRPLRFPVIEISPVTLDPLQLQELQQPCDLLVFISVNAVTHGLPQLASCLAQQPRIAAIGSKTAKALSTAGLKVDILPAGGSSSEALLAHPAMQSLQGRRVVVVRGGQGREILLQTLRERGATVLPLNVYQRQRPEPVTDLNRLLTQADAVAITSNEGLENLLAMADATARQRIQALPLLAGSRRVLELATELELPVRGILADSPADEAMLTALLEWVQSGDQK